MQKTKPKNHTDSLPMSDTSGRERLAFQDFQFKAFANGRCSTAVTLGWRDGVTYDGNADGTQTLEGKLRCGALASLAAAENATQGQVNLDLLGVKALRAFDQWIVIVLIRGRGEEDTYRLLGSYATAEDEAAKGAALAVLDATNRILEKYM
jgi:hypothetical protein